MRCVHPALASRLLAVFPDSFDGALLMKLSRPFLVVLALFCAFGLMFAPTVWASPTGSIAGSVKDPSGAVISSAETHARQHRDKRQGGSRKRQQWRLSVPATDSGRVFAKRGSRRLQEARYGRHRRGSRPDHAR